jgi:hypothetical protein
MSSKVKNERACGNCQHYCWTLGPVRKTTCNNLGSIETTPACPDYTINPFVLQDFEKVLKPLADTLRVMPLTVLPLFYEVISQEKALRRRGFYFMEKVAIKYWGTPSEKFVSNYIVAHVYSATKEGIFVIAKSGARMYVLNGSIIKLELFLDLRKELKAKGKIIDPTLSSRASNKQKLAVTETLDDIIARGMVEDLDTDLKKKLNPKRINKGIEEDREGRKITELSMSTKKPGKSARDLEKAADKLLAKGSSKKDKKSELSLSTNKKKQPLPSKLTILKNKIKSRKAGGKIK